MSWSIDTWPPADREVAPNSYANTGPAVLSGGFAFQLRPTGDTEQWEFHPVSRLLPLPPRALIRLRLDGDDWFFGVVPDPPSPGTRVSVPTIVLGGREALRVSLMDGAVYRAQGVFQIVRDILSRRCPPGIGIDPALIGDGSGTDAGPALDLFYSPTAPLTEVFDGLAKSAGTTWGVNRSGVVEFGRPQTGVLVVNYAGQPWTRLSVQGRDTVTEATLRIVSAPSDGVAGYTFSAGAFELYLPGTVTTVAQSADHPTYLASAAVTVPDGVSVLKDHRAGDRYSSGMSAVENAFDTDPQSSADSTDTLPQLSLVVTGPRVVGLRISYELTTADGVSAQLKVIHHSDPTRQAGDLDDLSLTLPAGRRELVALLPPSAALNGRVVASLLQVVTRRAPLGTQNVLKVYDFAALVVDEAAATNVATSFLQSPFPAPVEIIMDGLVPPQPTVQVVGHPDGLLEGPAALFEYEHQPDGTRRTKIRIGSTGQSGAVRALKRVLG